MMVRVKKGKDQGREEAERGDDSRNQIAVTCDKAKRQKPFPAFKSELRRVVFKDENGSDLVDEDGESVDSAWLAPAAHFSSEWGMSDDERKRRVCEVVMEILQTNFKPGETPCSSDVLLLLKARGITKHQLYDSRNFGLEEGLIDWKQEGRSTRWSLGPKAIRRVEEQQSAIPLMASERAPIPDPEGH